MNPSAPEPLTAQHLRGDFNCGEIELDDWLKQRSLKNEDAGASRTYVIAVDRQVVGYYALATGSIVASEAPGRVRRNMPNPIPAMVLGRLAIDQAWQGQRLGTSLLKDAVLRTVQAADIAGIRVLLVHALHERAAEFYRKNGFIPSPGKSHTLMLPLKTARALLEE